MQYKPIKNCHVENTIIGKDYNLGATGSFFHASPMNYKKTKEKINFNFKS
jgi:hypothetical protein